MNCPFKAPNMRPFLFKEKERGKHSASRQFKTIAVTTKHVVESVYTMKAEEFVSHSSNHNSDAVFCGKR